MSDRNRRKSLSHWTMCAVLAVVLAVPSVAVAADAVQLRFATVGIGSAWYNYGAGIADLVKPNLPKGSTVDVLPIAGTVGNMKLLQSGETELGLSFPNVAAEGCGRVRLVRQEDRQGARAHGRARHVLLRHLRDREIRTQVVGRDRRRQGADDHDAGRRFRRVGPAPDPRALWEQQEGTWPPREAPSSH